MATKASKDNLTADLEAAQDSLKGIKDALEINLPLSLPDLDIILDDLHELCNGIADLKSRTFRLYPASERSPHVLLVTDLKYNLNEAKKSASIMKAQLQQQQQQQQQASHMQLPPLRISKFDGSYGSWKSFLDRFTAAVDKNQSQPPAAKLQHLISLTIDAVPIVDSYQLTDDNYPIVLDYLKKRFGHQRETINCHFKKLFNMPSLTGQSAAGLQSITDTTTEVVRCLDTLGIKLDNGLEHLLVYMIIQRLDYITKRDFESSLPDDRYPKLDVISNFMETRARALSVAPMKEKQTRDPTPGSSKEPQQQYKRDSSHANSTHPNSTQPTDKRKTICGHCKQDHFIAFCPGFKVLTPLDRSQFIRDKKGCINCLNMKHSLVDCKNPRTCPTESCGKRHHPLLHFGRGGSNGTTQVPPTNTVTSYNRTPTSHTVTTTITSHNFTQPENQAGESEGGEMVLLGTALVELKGPTLQLTGRSLIDNGSQCHLISEEAVQKLGLPRHKSNQPILGATGIQVGTSKGTTTLQVFSRIQPEWSRTITAYIVDKVSTELPQQKFDTTTWNHIVGLGLADPKFSTPGKIDLLLGAGIYNDLLLDLRITGSTGTPTAQQTTLGFVLCGNVDAFTVTPTPIISNLITTEVEEFDLRKFWELEELPITEKMKYSQEEQDCILHFKTTHKRKEDGRYQVRLPFKSTAPPLGFSRNQAVKRWSQVEKRLQSNPEKKKEYHDFMKEYLELGHMRPVPPERMNVPPDQHYYLPHHFVCKDSSSTTKLRVVFDGGAVSTTGRSLNDNLMTPPIIQRPLWDLLLAWRLYLVSLKGDIEKLFRQTETLPPDQNFQRIVHRADPNQPLVDYELVTVTYGTKSAPGDATMALNQLAEDEKEQFPIGATSLKEDLYIDDLMGGGHSLKEALNKQNEIINIAKRGQLNMRKWSSNHPSILEAVHPEQRETQVPLELGKTENVKALGIQWNPQTDQFEFKLNFQINSNPTMRAILSNIARLFDPIGFLAPVTMTLKLYMKDLWTLKLGWDTTIPQNFQSQWKLLLNSLKDLEKIKIPRYVSFTIEGTIQLHGSSDASEKAISFCIHIRHKSKNNKVTSHLLTGKTKVAPEKNISLARLELQAALHLARLMKAVIKALRIPIEKIYYWTDSSIVLHWLQKSPNHWKTYIANRVSEIQESTEVNQWYHIKSEENPSDCASRGMLAADLVNFNLWWFGPPWLQTDNFPTGPIPGSSYTDKQLEKRKIKTSFHTTTPKTNDLLDSLSKYSSWFTTKKITAYFLRAIFNFQNPQKKSGQLTIQELKKAETWILQLVQQKHFPHELRSLKSKQQIDNKSQLLRLNPFLDKDGLLRVGGRLDKSNLSEDRKHPIVLPRTNHTVDIIIDNYHRSFLHGGNQLILAHLTGRFYILHARHTIRQVIRRCVKCIKFNSETASQLMASLPSTRVTPSRPFDICGVDFGGPYILRNPIGKNRKTTYKGYLCLFTCFSTRAIHVEAASSLSTEGFLSAFYRFIARRGLPSHMYSDCGTNFEGSANELKEQTKLVETLVQDKLLLQEMLKREISWHFNSPAAPHFGSIWEVGVKLIKHHLRRSLNNEPVTFEEFSLLLASCESMVNSRPLNSLTTDPEDLRALTPGHFLIGTSLTDPPEPDLTDVPMNRLDRFQLIQRKKQEFWVRWTQEYLTKHQTRPKWMTPQPELKIGDLVILKEDNLPPKEWKLARITEIHPGQDNHVRVVTLKLKSGYDKQGRLFYTTLKRPITKIVSLPTDGPIPDCNELTE